MRQKSTFVALFFVVAAIIVAFTLSFAFGTLFAALHVTNRPILGDRLLLSGLSAILTSVALAAATFLHPRTNRQAGDVVEELYKVNWPTWPETKVNTLVVIVTSVVAAAILGVFDVTFAWLSNRLL